MWGTYKVRRGMSLRDSFAFFLRSTCNSPAEARSTCVDIVDGAPSRRRLSVPTPLPNGLDFDEDTAPPQVVAAGPPPPRRPSRPQPAWLLQPYTLHHHLHLVTADVILCHLRRRCLCNHHDPLPPLLLTWLPPQPSMLLAPPSPHFLTTDDAATCLPGQCFLSP
jgi:hypothetical protein